MRLKLLAALSLALFADALRGDTIVLVGGGRIEGQVLNPQESPREKYVVALATGGQATFAKGQVTRIVTANSAEAQYDSYLQKMPDTVDGHWKMAEWCVRNNLIAQREFHLREIVRLEPGHEKARLGLGYTNIDGHWVLPEEQNKRLGYVKHNGAWRAPQDILISEQRQKVDDAERKWRADIKMWRGWLNRPSKMNDGWLALKQVNDPLASPAIADMLDDKEEQPQVRLLCVELLGAMAPESPYARGVLVNHVLYDHDPEIRGKCLDELERLKPHHRALGAMFAKALGDKKNEVVNRAAVALERLGDTESIPQLIDALTTKHKFVVTSGSGNISTSFSPGGTGFSAGNKPQQIERDINNDRVRQALVALTGGKDLSFDRDAWRKWYAESRVPPDIDLRRAK